MTDIDKLACSDTVEPLPTGTWIDRAISAGYLTPTDGDPDVFEITMKAVEEGAEPGRVASTPEPPPVRTGGEKQPTFERVDGKMSEAEHDHILVNAFAANGLTLGACAEGYSVDYTSFANRTAAWVYLKMYEHEALTADKPASIPDPQHPTLEHLESVAASVAAAAVRRVKVNDDSYAQQVPGGMVLVTERESYYEGGETSGESGSPAISSVFIPGATAAQFLELYPVKS